MQELLAMLVGEVILLIGERAIRYVVTALRTAAA
jgi:hypothetical protein